MYEQRFFGAEAQKHFRGILGWDDPISKALLGLPIEQGTVWAYLPPEFKMYAPDDFRNGEAWDLEDPHGGSDLVIRFIWEYLQASPTRLALFECIWYQNEPAARECITPYVLIGEPRESRGRLGCLYVMAQDASPDTIEEAMAAARPWPFVGALTSMPDAWAPLHPMQVLSDSEAQELAVRTEHLLTDAFDDSAMLIWSRRLDAEPEA